MFDITIISSNNPLMKKISSRMPAIKKSMEAFGKKNSQTSSSLMSLNMIDSGPYRVIKQILAQINNKYAALKEAAYNHELNLIRLDEIKYEIEDSDTIGIKRLGLEKRKILSDIDDSKIYIEATIKEIGAFQERYFEILKNHNIPENWTEKDFEDAEIKHHIVQMFKNAIRDRLVGRANHGTMEYMEQFGIEPIVAYRLVDAFIERTYSYINDSNAPSIEERYKFYDEVYEVFKEEYKKAMKRIGLSSITYDEWLIRGSQ